MLKHRGSGVLLHITSLPSICGIGGLGPWAYRFADFLYEARQSFWQVLPLTPSSPASFNSPYSSFSAFAGNWLLISAEMLVQDGLIAKETLANCGNFSDGKVDYQGATEFKTMVMNEAFENFKKKGDCEFEHFCGVNAFWLDDFALFVALSEKHGWQSWDKWPVGLRDREPGELNAARMSLSERITKEKFIQYIFFKQWFKLKEYCNNIGIQLFGDTPIYMDYNSADVWANPQFYKLDANRHPTVVAGVPPDYFSSTGQRWGNPVYNWDELKKSNFKWWIRRIGHNIKMFDSVRVDHFRGLVAYWEVPANEQTAINGKWVDVPKEEFFAALYKRFANLPIIAEDLGLITPDVREFMYRFDFAGMKVLLFAFDESMPRNPYIPHNINKNSIVYTGTHDNNTVKGWFDAEASEADKKRLASYLGHEPRAESVSWDFIRLAMMSVGNTVIIPMQDLLGLGPETRMNLPSRREGNWTWRVMPEQINPALAKTLADVTRVYGRG